jgi:hypothetical protein
MGTTTLALHWRPVGGWYWIGVAVGFGVAIGVLLGAVLGVSTVGTAIAAVIGAGLGVLVGMALGDWPEALGGGVGGVAGAAGVGRLLQGALRTGGTRAGTAILLGAGAVGVAALALVPGIGYLEAVAVPVLGARLRRRTSERYAGLRSLAD